VALGGGVALLGRPSRIDQPGAAAGASQRGAGVEQRLGHDGGHGKTGIVGQIEPTE